MNLIKYTFPTNFGYFTAVAANNRLIRLIYGEMPGENSDCDLLYSVEKQINEYLAGIRKSFDIEYYLKGTDFQKEVWQALTEIPYGSTVSYEDIAVKIGRPKALRAVGTAIKVNPLPLIIPCHRVIRKSGNLGEYALGKNIKQKLLKIEKNI